MSSVDKCEHVTKCSDCGKTICSYCVEDCSGCSIEACKKCYVAHQDVCKTCEDTLCPEELLENGLCAVCDMKDGLTSN